MRAVAILAAPLLPLERDPLSLELRAGADDGAPDATRQMRAVAVEVTRSLAAHELLHTAPLEVDLRLEGWEVRPMLPMRTPLSCQRWRCELLPWLEVNFPHPPLAFRFGQTDSIRPVQSLRFSPFHRIQPHAPFRAEEVFHDHCPETIKPSCSRQTQPHATHDHHAPHT